MCSHGSTGTIFGRDVVPEVKRMKASSAPDAKSSAAAVPARPDKVEGAEPVTTPGDRSRTAMPSEWAMLRLAEFTSARVSNAAIRRSQK